MSSFTDHTENLVLNFLLTTNTATRPTAWYVGLFTAAPSDTGGGTEVSGNGYARVAITNNATNFPARQYGIWVISRLCWQIKSNR
jgi:hypothetical protein